MNTFELLEPQTLDETLGLLAAEDPTVRLIAGGTALMLMMKARLFQPTRLISLRRLNGAFRGVRVDSNGGLLVGAMTTLSELEYSPLVAETTPVVSRALRTLSNVRVRNVATLGGHLAHGDPHMDLPPILMTLGSRVRVTSRRGARWIDVADLFVSYYQTAVEPDELITEVAVTAQPAGSHAWYEKFTALSADDWPAVGVAVYYRCEMGSGVIYSGHSQKMTSDPIVEARIAVGAATERPMRVPAAEAALVGSRPSHDTFAKAADVAADAVEPVTDLRGSAAYKREMVRVHVRRALQHAQSSGFKESR